ncbi:MAG: exo-alpha-sialidase [Phycisphaerae bacterium]|nr:exo-alpha-sialidase [Phycisphaerae bacterium]
MLRAACAMAAMMGLFPAVAAEPPADETLLVIEPSKAYPRNSEGDLIELRDGRLYFVYTRFTGGGADHAAAEIVARTSSDGGRQWSEDRVVVANEGAQNVMSASILRLRDGALLLFYLRKNDACDCTAYVRRSTDEFETLGEPVRVSVADGYHVVNNDRVVQLSTGRLVVPAAWHPCQDGDRKVWGSRALPRVFVSDDEGRTWRMDADSATERPMPQVVLQEPGVVELTDKRLWMWFRTDKGVQYSSFSKDGGLRWSEPEPSRLASPLSPATIERIPWTGDLLCVWNDHSGRHVYPKGKRSPLCVAISRDDGQTWTPSRVIEGDPEGWYCYTSITFLKDRAILSYCAGDKKVGGLNRLKMLALSRAWLYRDE